MRQDQIALQLYTVRRLLASDLPGTLAAVADAGYRSVELAALHDVPADELARRLDEAGLAPVSSHEGMDRLRADPGAVADRLRTLGCPRIVVPSMPEADRVTVDDVRRFAAELGGWPRRSRTTASASAITTTPSSSRRSTGRPLWDVLLPSSRRASTSSSTSTGWRSAAAIPWPRSGRHVTGSGCCT